MGFPKLLCIGAQKAGTTWFHGMLSQHPGVFRGPLKECHYFNSLHFRAHRRRAKRIVKNRLNERIAEHKKNTKNPDRETIAWLESLAAGRRIFKGDWYEQVFSGPGSQGKITFETTPAYSTLPLIGIKDVRSLLGDVSIIYIIRDPLNRILSQIRMKASKKFGDKPIAESEWIALRDNMRERGDYKSYIPRWLSVFPESNIHFIPFKRISAEPDGVMRDVENLVGLPPHRYENLRRKLLESTRFDVPPSVVDLLTENVAPQYAFLEQHFGKDFMDLI